jgi:hypothetical protein
MIFVVLCSLRRDDYPIGNQIGKCGLNRNEALRFNRKFLTSPKTLRFKHVFQIGSYYLVVVSFFCLEYVFTI